MEVWINWESHHYLLYRFDSQSNADQAPDGLREVTLSNASFEDGRTLIAAFQNSQDLELPPGTAYFWDDVINFEHNLHIPNVADQDSVLKADVYINLYKRPRHTLSTEMHASLYIYQNAGIWPFNSDFMIPADGQDHTFTESFFDGSAANTDTAHLWLLSTHTHKWGTDYDIYARNSNDTKGEQLYEGFMDPEHTFNQGYYDWEHPPTRYFPNEDLKKIAWNDGLIHEATYNNAGTSLVTFGLTTEDEMMLIFYQWTDQEPIPFTSVEEADNLNNLHFGVMPNPVLTSAKVAYSIPRGGPVTVEMYDLLGNRKAKLVDEIKPSGRHLEELEIDATNLTPGMYILKITANNQTESRKVIVLKR